MGSGIEVLKKAKNGKEIKSEFISFKLTPRQKRRLIEISDTYGKSYGFIVNLIIEQVYRAMLDDEYTKLLNNAKKLHATSETCFEILKRDNPEGYRIAQGVWRGLGEVCADVLSVNNDAKEKLIKFQTEVDALNVYDREEISSKEQTKVLSMIKQFIDEVKDLSKDIEKVGLNLELAI